MKILSAADIRNWDQYTINNEPISSINLMERASSRVVEWLTDHFPDAEGYQVFCGKGNNGGDGLAIARILAQKNYAVSVYVVDLGQKGTNDFQLNLTRIQHYKAVPLHFIRSEEDLPALAKNKIIIDAIFGSGLNRAIEGITLKLVEHINSFAEKIIAIDIPSGLFTDRSSSGNTTIHATYTLSFQCMKPAFLFAENESAVGEIQILEIGLLPAFNDSVSNEYELTDVPLIQSIHRPRKRFSHKGSFGHALMIAGSYGKIGAAILSVRSCLRSGAGLVTAHIPNCGYEVMQTTAPEAMVSTDQNKFMNTHINEDLTKFDSIGIGPGIGTASETKRMLREIFDAYRSPLVLDADALNIIASQKDLLALIPAGSIITPHPKEFERLFGESSNDFERAQLATTKARELNIIIVLKGHYTFIATPGKELHGFFNSTGNPGMATGGSGDVLTGILTGLLAQGYSSVEAAILGTYIHGLAGDFAAEQYAQESMIAGDIIINLGEAFKCLATHQ